MKIYCRRGSHAIKAQKRGEGKQRGVMLGKRCATPPSLKTTRLKNQNLSTISGRKTSLKGESQDLGGNILTDTVHVTLQNNYCQILYGT